MSEMMKCGHAAQGTSNGKPACAICPCFEVATASPDLEGRQAKCSYDNKHGPHVGHNGNRAVQGPVPSHASLAFFAYRPDQPFDSYFCGCWGWD